MGHMECGVIRRERDYAYKYDTREDGEWNCVLVITDEMRKQHVC